MPVAPPRPRRKQRRSPGLFPILLILVAGLAVIKWIDPFASRRFPAPATPDWITADLLPVNPYSRPGEPLDTVNCVVVHYVGNPGTTAAQNHSYFEGLAQTGETYASSHFLIGLDGEILLNVPLDEIAYCSNDRNEDTISIECCHPDGTGAFTPETYNALVRLVRWLMEYYQLEPSQILRHYDVTGKACPLYFVDHPDAWERFLGDVSPAEE